MTELESIMNNEDAQIGEFLVGHNIITREVLDEAMSLQRDNPTRLIGEILVTLGAMAKEEVIMAIEMFLVVTNSSLQPTHEWLDQDEIDIILNKMNSKHS